MENDESRIVLESYYPDRHDSDTHARPDIIVVEKEKRKWTIIDIAVPGDFNVVRKYQYLAFEVYTRIHRQPLYQL